MAVTPQEVDLDFERIVKDLKRERDRLNRAIAVLEESPSSDGGAKRAVTPVNAIQNGKGQGRNLTPAGRKRLSEAMKKRWAERRRKGV